ncbi:LysR substrate-binding domain-containing protein [Rhizobiaceae bacterium BDR2-2]|uniref:LysR substrate-binding domain-containing protein n=1 Tax=Ectorhizobium quercum TaxID=2965071 RepID=A0AAE3SUM4_9HYPH|nr:LysR substrate-binding domain-containing protein [Ectorhizobium quercum]MCX8997237.1 LysR substrate-binding domain-containing protein [Ectorhizobium quercum]
MKLNSENTNLNLRHLRAAHAVWREGSFSRAAERLGVVPSALTETIRQLEEIAGVTLFDRRLRPPRPTPLGLEFLDETRPLVEGLDRAFGRLRENGDLARGALNIGASPSAISGRLAPALAAFRQSYPGVAITLHDDIAERLAALVSEGRLDIAIAGRAGTSPDISQTEIGSDPFGLACRADHPLARLGRPVRLADIDPSHLVHLDGNTGTARLLAGCSALPDAMRNGTLRAHSTVGQLCLIRAGIGVGLLPRNAVLLFNDPQLSFLEIADLSLNRHLYLLLPARRALSHVAERFVALLHGAPAGQG